MSSRPNHIPRATLIAMILVGLSLNACIFEVGLPASGDNTFAPVNPVPGMHVQPLFKDQSDQPFFKDESRIGMRTPPPGTVPTTGHPRTQFADLDQADLLQNPVPRTEDNLEFGRFLFDENCAVCHGLDGHGQGTIVAAGHFGQPPTLNSDNLRARSDGRIYHIITYGQNSMWPYKNNLTEMERWAVVNYVRALQRADFPEPTDLDQMQNQ